MSGYLEKEAQEKIKEFYEGLKAYIKDITDKEAWKLACITYEYSLFNHGVWKGNT